MPYTPWMTGVFCAALIAALIGLVWVFASAIEDAPPTTHNPYTGTEWGQWYDDLPQMEHLGALRADKEVIWFYKFRDHRFKDCMFMTTKGFKAIGVDCQ